jgi:hypothetical protein
VLRTGSIGGSQRLHEEATWDEISLGYEVCNCGEPEMGFGDCLFYPRHTHRQRLPATCGASLTSR